MNDLIKRHLSDHSKVLSSINNETIDKIDQIAELIVTGLKNNKTIFWCGNGGSACDSQHLSAELVGRFDKTRIALKAISLNADSAALTCIANDFGYDKVFSRQLEALGSEEDIMIAITTSGLSKNIMEALNQANKMSIKTILLSGKNGGACKGKSDHEIIIKSDTTARIQEMHIMIGHILCDLIETKMDL